MSASAVFILDLKGRLLISRDYRGDIPTSVATKFATRVLQQEETELRPVVNEEGISYISVKYANLLCLLLLISLRSLVSLACSFL